MIYKTLEFFISKAVLFSVPVAKSVVFNPNTR